MRLNIENLCFHIWKLNPESYNLVLGPWIKSVLADRWGIVRSTNQKTAEENILMELIKLGYQELTFWFHNEKPELWALVSLDDVIVMCYRDAGKIYLRKTAGR